MDTVGAWPTFECELLGQSEAIASNLTLMAGLRVPIVTLIVCFSQEFTVRFMPILRYKSLSVCVLLSVSRWVRVALAVLWVFAWATRSACSLRPTSE